MLGVDYFAVVSDQWAESAMPLFFVLDRGSVAEFTQTTVRRWKLWRTDDDVLWRFGHFVGERVDHRC